jgi:hypothetical protein
LSDGSERARRRKPGPPRAEPRGGQRTPPTLRFNPFAIGLAVFTGIAIPFVVVGYTRASGVNATIIVVGVAIGLVAGVIAGLWVAERGGRIWKGPQL